MRMQVFLLSRGVLKSPNRFPVPWGTLSLADVCKQEKAKTSLLDQGSRLALSNGSIWVGPPPLFMKMETDSVSETLCISSRTETRGNVEHDRLIHITI
jgi:hypothetical protein